MAVKVTVFAHGADADEDKKVSSGWSDAGLSDLGVEQSKKLKEIIKDRHFDAVFCSDLKRAVDTVKLAFNDAIPVIQDVRLRECNYGTLNGAPKSTVEPMQEGQCVYNRFPEGESYEDVKNKTQEFLNFLKENYDGKSVAIVSHKANQLSLEVLLNGKTWEQAIALDWRKTKAWQPGWGYELN